MHNSIDYKKTWKFDYLKLIILKLIFLQEEDIYEDLCAFKKDGSLSDFVPKEKRDYCLKELVETEAKYLEVLNMLKNHFIKAPSLTLKDHEKKMIFMNVTELIDLHQEFYAKIFDYFSKYIESSRSSFLGPIFLEYKKQFLIYSSYCCELPRGQLSDIQSRNSCVTQTQINNVFMAFYQYAHLSQLRRKILAMEIGSKRASESEKLT